MRAQQLLIVIVPTLLAAALSAEDAAAEQRKKLFRERLAHHFMFGVDAPVEWHNETRDKNGAKWDARVQYFSGGAAKSSWDTVFLDPWNKWVNPDKKRGVWGENFIKACTENGYIAWITFYNLAQSAPAEYKPGPAEATPRNAAVKETMRAYFEQVKLLMQICDKYKPHPIVVQFEPDEWGHLLLSKRGPNKQMDPEWVDVKVGSTGMEEIKDLPDNLVGYAKAIKRLRDKYSPTNVMLGCNPSGWDWKQSMTGAKFGEYLNKCGCNEWELAVFETGDRDKGMHGKAPPYGDSSGICETFDNHIKWISEFHKTTGLYVVVWQAAMGNTYFATCDNTPGHYCDNLAQTLLEDYPRNTMIARYAEAGCIGWMFNGGQGASTNVYDAKKDGITNPPAIAGNLGKKSEYADDDGGYMRLKVGEYFKRPHMILGKAPKAMAASAEFGPASPGAPAAPADAKPKAAPAAKAEFDAKKLEPWDEKLKERLSVRLQGAKKLETFLRINGPKSAEQKTNVTGFQNGNLLVDVQGNAMPFAWKTLSLRERSNLARSLSSKDDAGSLIVAAIFLLADGRDAESEEFFANAALVDAAAVTNAKATLAK